jgi:predicted transcriptional regulator
MMLANPKVNKAAIFAEIGITTRGVQKSIDVLKELGLVERVGPGNGGYWAGNLPKRRS